MPEPVEIFRYIRYLRLRWRWVAICCAVSVILAAAVTALQSRQYTATARILIDPPVGADLRSATAVSPVRSEMLLTEISKSCALADKTGAETTLKAIASAAPMENARVLHDWC